VPRGRKMRRIEFSRRLEEASCGGRGELLNRWSRVQIPAPAPFVFRSHRAAHSNSRIDRFNAGATTA
jgi:hypothetical protein